MKVSVNLREITNGYSEATGSRCPIEIDVGYNRRKVFLTVDDAKQLVKHLSEALSWLGRKDG